MKTLMRRKLSKSDRVRERLAPTKRPRRRGQALLNAISDVIGSVDGLPSDLSTRTKKYLRSMVYGGKHPR
jgi:hypothetical protein